MWFYVALGVILVAVLGWAALFDRRRRRAGREPGDRLHADRRRVQILTDETTVLGETMNRDRSRGGTAREV